MMMTQRMVVKIMTTKPPVKRNPSPSFFQVGMLVFQSIGNGMDMRYRSVKTLVVYAVMTMGRDTAAWQWSRSRVSFGLDYRNEWRDN